MLPLRTIKKGGIAKTSSKNHVLKLDIVYFCGCWGYCFLIFYWLSITTNKNWIQLIYKSDLPIADKIGTKTRQITIY